ncbi:MAG: alpha/beta fold hydrolase [Gemmatimonas sp.]
MRLARWLTAAFMVALLLMLAYSAVAAPDIPVAVLTPRWAPAPSVLRPVDGVTAHLRDEGPRNDSVPVLLLHGTSASLHTWEGWSAALRSTRRVISVDLPGFGLTGPDPLNDYRIERYTRFVVALLDSLGVRRADVAGNSLGGEIAWETAARAPDRVRKLVLVDPAGFKFTSESVPLGFRLARTPSLSWLFTRILPRGVVESSVRSVYGDPEKVTDALVDRYYQLTLRTGNRTVLAHRFAQTAPGADTARLASITAPTLILWGGRDQLIPPSDAARFQRLLPRATLIMYPELGHVPHEEDAARTVRDVLAFLRAP